MAQWLWFQIPSFHVSGPFTVGLAEKMAQIVHWCPKPWRKLKPAHTSPKLEIKCDLQWMGSLDMFSQPKTMLKLSEITPNIACVFRRDCSAQPIRGDRGSPYLRQKLLIKFHGYPATLRKFLPLGKLFRCHICFPKGGQRVAHTHWACRTRE